LTQQHQPGKYPASIAEVGIWYRDYLSALYDHIERKLANDIAGTSWQRASIEFVFSVPTTWKPKPTIENFKRIAKSA